MGESYIIVLRPEGDGPPVECRVRRLLKDAIGRHARRGTGPPFRESGGAVQCPLMLSERETIMGDVRLTFTQQVRRAVDADGRSRYRLCKLAKIGQPSMSKFMAGQGLAFDALDRLADVLGLQVAVKDNKAQVTNGKHRQ